MKTALYAVLLLTACEGVIATRAPAEQPGDEVTPLPGTDPTMPVQPVVPEEPPCEGQCVGPSASARVTAAEYQNAVLDVFGVTTGIDFLPGDGSVGGTFFANQTDSLSGDDVDRYRTTAESVAALVVATARLTALLAPLTACATRHDLACADAFIARYAPRLYKRPLLATETTTYHELYRWTLATATDPGFLTGGSGTFDDGIRFIVEQLLQSPGFLYRAERGTPTADADIVALDSHEVAARLAAFVLRSVPDAELLAAAGRGELKTPEQIAAQTRRLLATPKGDRLWAGFAADWLSTRQIPDSTVTGLPEASAKWSDAVADDLMLDVQQTFAHVAREDGRLSTLLTSPGAVLQGDSLAWLIGTTGTRGTWAPQVPYRHGILTLPGVLIGNGHPGFTHAHQRGLFVRSRVLCQRIGEPSPEIAAAISAIRMNEENNPTAQTARGRLEAVTERAALCASCHHLTNPIGFGLDGYDDLGRHRDVEVGLDGKTYPLDTSGELKGRPDGTLSTDADGSFTNGDQLLDRLAGSATVARCMTQQFARFALGRELAHDDQPSLNQSFASFDGAGRDLRELVVALTTSESFRHRRTSQ